MINLPIIALVQFPGKEKKRKERVREREGEIRRDRKRGG